MRSYPRYAIRSSLGFGMGGLFAGAFGAAVGLLSDDLLALAIPLSFVVAVAAPAIAAAVLIEDMTPLQRVTTALKFGLLSAVCAAVVGGLITLIGLGMSMPPPVTQGQVTSQMSHLLARSLGLSVTVMPLAAAFSLLYLYRFLRISSASPYLIWLCGYLSFAVAGAIVAVLVWVVFTSPGSPSFYHDPVRAFLRPVLEYSLGGYLFGIGLDWLAGSEQR